MEAMRNVRYWLQSPTNEHRRNALSTKMALYLMGKYYARRAAIVPVPVWRSWARTERE
jgi:hypothetical protein